MKKEIKDYLHLYLLKECEYEWQPEDLILKGRVTTRIIEGMQNGRVIWCKPILRPLSDMTDDEYMEVGNILCTSQGEQAIKQLIADATYMIHIQFSFELTFYLLKQGFDIFNLIPEGIALDKTLIK